MTRIKTSAKCCCFVKVCMRNDYVETVNLTRKDNGATVFMHKNN